MTKNTQQEILKVALKLVPDVGWSEELIAMAGALAGISKDYAKLVFIGGVKDLIRLHVSNINIAMIQELEATDIANLGVSAKIKLALKTRFKIFAVHKQVLAKTVSYLALPWNMPLGVELGWQTVDFIWREVASDASHDFNFYTKRGLLYTVYMASIHFFLSDSSKNHRDTDDFIDRKIDNVLRFGKWIAKKT